MSKLPFRQIHLDFHTSEQIAGVGEAFSPEDFARTLEEAAVNSINLFARCHHGMVYYDSPTFVRHPHLKIDLLREQLMACRRRGIKTPIYITAGWDELVARTHPEWLERTPEGKPFGSGPLEPGWKKLCFNTPYVSYHETQVVEVLETFGDLCDGIWIDIIFQYPCCCTYCMASMEKQGLDPAREQDRVKHADDVLIAFKQRMTRTIRKYNSDCLIFFNAGHVGPYIRRCIDNYTHLELESLPGLREVWGYEHFPITARYTRTLGLEFIGMTGKFHKMWGDFGGFKNQAALEYECFTVLAHGAKCCIGDQLHPTGSLCKATYDLVGSVYRQVRDKEPWCDDVEAVSEIGVITPEPAEGTSHHMLSPAIRGAYRMLSEAHYQFDILDALSDFGRYKAIVLPDIITLNDDLRDRLRDYLDQGGKLLLSYKSGLDPAEKAFVLEDMGVRFVKPSPFDLEYFEPCDPHMDGMPKTCYAAYERALWVDPAGGTTVMADLWQPYFNRTYKHFCSHFQTPFEKKSGHPAATLNGNVAYFAHPIFAMYHVHGVRAYKQLVLSCLKQLLPNPIIRTNAPTTAQILLNRQIPQERYVAHLLHYIPEARSKQVDIIEDVIPLHNVRLSVRLPRMPRLVYLAPSRVPLPFTQADGRVEVTVPELHGHEMVVFELHDNGLAGR
jgi:hypothetical protein